MGHRTPTYLCSDVLQRKYFPSPWLDDGRIRPSAEYAVLYHKYIGSNVQSLLHHGDLKLKDVKMNKKEKMCLGSTVIVATCLALASSATATTGDPCGHGGGTILEVRNHDSYCVSLRTMNWWSAFAWCDAAGGHLVSMNEVCYDSSIPEDAPCPNLKCAAPEEYRLWTSSSQGPGNAYIVYAQTGGSSSLPKTYSPSTHAFCKI